MERQQNEKLAFDLRKYAAIESSRLAQQRLAEDLAGLSLELAEAEEMRITPFYFEQRGDKLVAPEFDEESDVLEMIEVNDRLDHLEYMASARIKEYILNQDSFPIVTIWLSPPFEEDSEQYPEGRINIGIGREKDELKIIDNWGIASRWNQETFIELGNWLTNFSEEPERQYHTSDQLRSEPFFIDKSKMAGREPLEFLKEIIPLKEKIWNQITSEEIKVLKKNNIRQARMIAQEVVNKMGKIQTREDWFHLGAMIEERMQKQIGYGFRSGSGCGVLNSEKVSSYAYSHTSVDSSGEAEAKILTSGEAKYVKKCGNCGATIEKRISAGYTCPECGGVYKGC